MIRHRYWDGALVEGEWDGRWEGEGSFQGKLREKKVKARGEALSYCVEGGAQFEGFWESASGWLAEVEEVMLARGGRSAAIVVPLAVAEGLVEISVGADVRDGSSRMC